MGDFKSRIPAIKKRVAIYSGINSVRRKVNKKPRVLFWHGVDSETDSLLCPENFNVSIFEKQICYLLNHYEIISIQEFEKRLNENGFNGREVLLTFDDGYANNLHIVEPILSLLNIPFTIFISTHNITTGDFYPTTVNRLITIGSKLSELEIPTLGKVFAMPTVTDRINTSRTIARQLKSQPLAVVKGIVRDLINSVSVEEWEGIKLRYKNLRPLNWNEVKKLSKLENVTIGSHCVWHICCHNKQDPEEVLAQLSKSKQLIEERLQSPCDYFAYPNGNFTDYSNKCVGSLYKLGFSAETKTQICNQHRSILPRIPGYTDLNSFKILLTSR